MTSTQAQCLLHRSDRDMRRAHSIRSAETVSDKKSSHFMCERSASHINFKEFVWPVLTLW